MVFSESFRTARAAHDAHWQSNFWIRVAQVIIAIVSLIVASVAITNASAGGAVVWIIFLVAWASTILWAIAHFIRLGTNAKPIHPGAVVGVDLVIWIIYLVATILGFFFFAITLVTRSNCGNEYDNDPYGYYSNGDGDYYYNACNYFDASSLTVASSVFEAFGGLALLILHFYLFVRGCVDVHRRRRAVYAALAAQTNGNYAPVPPTAQYGDGPYNVPMPTGQAVFQQGQGYNTAYNPQAPLK